jgi:hypothetical protein
MAANEAEATNEITRINATHGRREGMSTGPEKESRSTVRMAFWELRRACYGLTKLDFAIRISCLARLFDCHSP